MRIFFIRHSKAIDRAGWLNDDMLRPLSDRGFGVAKSFFKALSKVCSKPDIVFSSEATRARETAEIFCKYFGIQKFNIDSMLNPGFDIDKFLLLCGKNNNFNNIAIVGHEPDFSEIISSLVGTKDICLEIKKCSVVEVELVDGKAIIKSLIQPRVLV